MTVYLRDATRRRAVDSAMLELTAKRILAGVGEAGASVSVSLVGDAAIRRMNREHRGRDAATDVLSFPLYAPGERAGDGVERLLGDVVISVDTAGRQAAGYDAPLEDEVKRLLIHGILHLLGHDHEAADERIRMEAEERRLADAIGLRWPY